MAKSTFTSHKRTEMPKPRLLGFYKKVVWGVLKRKVTLNIDNQAGELPEQYVVVCNHPSAYDNFYCVVATYPKLTCFTTNRYYMFNKIVGGLLRSVGCIPKSLFTADMESVKNTLYLKNKGANFGYMPEVRLSLYGEFENLPESTAKFFKKLDLPVFLCHFDGSYLVKPKWSKKMRKGTIDVTIKKLFSQDELRVTSAESVHETIKQNLYYNDFEWLSRHPDLHYKCKKQAEGLQNILYKCPHCGKEFCIQTKKDKVFCTECGFSLNVDDRYSFVQKSGEPHYYDNFQQWFKAQKQTIVDSVANNPDYCLTEEVELFTESKNGVGFTKKAGNGLVKLDKNGLSYSGTKDNQKFDLFIPMHETFFLSYAINSGFQTFFGVQYYLFRPKIVQKSILWYLASEQFSMAFCNQKKQQIELKTLSQDI